MIEDFTDPTTEHLKELMTLASKVGKLDTKDEEIPLCKEKVLIEQVLPCVTEHMKKDATLVLWKHYQKFKRN